MVSGDVVPEGNSGEDGPEDTESLELDEPGESKRLEKILERDRNNSHKAWKNEPRAFFTSWNVWSIWVDGSWPIGFSIVERVASDVVPDSGLVTVAVMEADGV